MSKRNILDTKKYLTGFTDRVKKLTIIVVAKNTVQQKLHFIVARIGNDKIQSEASKIIAANLKSNSKISEVTELDLFQLVKIILPQTDPAYKIDSQKHLPELIRYLYKTNLNFSLITKPEIDEHRIDLIKAEEWVLKNLPNIIFALDPIVRDIMLILRRITQVQLAIISLPPRLYLDRLWASNEGDLWSLAFPENKEQLLAEFVDGKRIIIPGLPVGKAEFKSIEPVIARKKLHWKSQGLAIGVVTDGLLMGQVDELLERISAFPGLELSLIVLSSNEELITSLREKSQSYLAAVSLLSLNDNTDLLYSALDLIIALQDRVYLPKILAKHLPAIIISHRNKFDCRDGELDLLNSKNLLIKANSLKDVIWQTESILKDRKNLRIIKNQLAKQITKPSLEALVEEIFNRMKIK